jgi:hypothetical protein
VSFGRVRVNGGRTVRRVVGRRVSAEICGAGLLLPFILGVLGMWHPCSLFFLSVTLIWGVVVGRAPKNAAALMT